MKAEERAQGIEADLMREMWRHENDGLNGQELREGPFREVLIRHILAAQREAEAETIKRCAEEIRASCGACGGTGMAAIGGVHLVTHEMALDAGQPEREGEIYAEDDPVECEYCGRPVDAIRALPLDCGDPS